ncbi:MAG TPA: TRAP transporter small permease [Rhabdaerophilum sp.]|nr:TRAP transporter small permease [Rhabdaerophilum sp.]
MSRTLATLRPFLDRLYRSAAVLAALCLIAILAVIVAQMVTRWISVPFPGSSEYAGYLMASASFLAFAHALNRGAHIRVNLLLKALGHRARPVELWCYLIGTAASWYMAWFAVRMVYFSHILGDYSQGQDELPMWLPQIPMALGAIILAIAFLDNLLTLIATGKDNVVLDPHAVQHVES